MNPKLLLSLIIYSLFTVVFAGSVFEIEVIDGLTQETSIMEILVEGEALKMNSIEDEDVLSDMIFRSNPREMITLDHESQSFFFMDDAMLEMLQVQFGGQREENIAALENLNVAMKAAYEAAVAGLNAQNLSAQERTAALKVINETFGIDDLPEAPSAEAIEILEQGRDTKDGYSVRVYSVVQGGEVLQELYVTDWSNLDYGLEAQATFEHFFAFFADMSEAFNEMGFGNGSGLDSFALMNKLDGFPVYGQTFDKGELDSEFSLKSTSRRAIDPAAFEPPAGYKRQEMF